MNNSDMVSNILAVYSQATSYEKVEGAVWYSADAWQFCLNNGWAIAARLGQLSQELSDRHWATFFAAVVSVMSPQKEWRVNKALAVSAVGQIMDGEAVTGHYGAQCTKVTKLFQYFLLNRGIAYHQNKVLDIISKGDSKKTRNFFLNIVGATQAVTVDGHAASICENGTKRVAITATGQPSGKKYDAYAAAYAEAAKELELEPSVLQAITWLTYRRMDLLITKK